MRSTGDEMHIGAGAVERGTDVGAYRAGAENCHFHGSAPFGLRDTAEVGEGADRREPLIG
jgi:hypothetical protein